MKTSLDHLPVDRQAQLTAVAAHVRTLDEVDKLILFGSHARGNWVVDHKTGYRSDYDLLVVVASVELAEDFGLWGRVEDVLRELCAPTPVTLLAYDIGHLNQEIHPRNAPPSRMSATALAPLNSPVTPHLTPSEMCCRPPLGEVAGSAAAAVSVTRTPGRFRLAAGLAVDLTLAARRSQRAHAYD